MRARVPSQEMLRGHWTDSKYSTCPGFRRGVAKQGSQITELWALSAQDPVSRAQVGSPSM